MAKIVSFVTLLVVLLIIGGLFLRVMAGFVLPLFLALLLVIIFGPLHRWLWARCGRRPRVAAMLTTVAILAAVLVPVLLLLLAAGHEAESLYREAMDNPAVVDETPAAGTPASKLQTLVDRAADWVVKLASRVDIHVKAEDLTKSFADAGQQFLTPLALRTTQLLGQTLMGLLVMILGVYYFFADGPVMLETLLRLSPLETGHTEELIHQFDNITRAVVGATLVSALVQGLLIGLGYYVAGIGSLFLLIALTMLLTLVPFVGSAIVWAPVCLWTLGVDGRTSAAVVLAAYCLIVAVTCDNVLKPLLLHGRSNLHPLLALLSVLGGIQALGPIGVLVGPMVVALLQTLLNMVHDELAARETGEWKIEGDSRH